MVIRVIATDSYKCFMCNIHNSGESIWHSASKSKMPLGTLPVANVNAPGVHVPTTRAAATPSWISGTLTTKPLFPQVEAIPNLTAKLSVFPVMRIQGVMAADRR
jgi:hypothetical protein